MKCFWDKLNNCVFFYVPGEECGSDIDNLEIVTNNSANYQINTTLGGMLNFVFTLPVESQFTNIYIYRPDETYNYEFVNKTNEKNEIENCIAFNSTHTLQYNQNSALRNLT